MLFFGQPVHLYLLRECCFGWQSAKSYVYQLLAIDLSVIVTAYPNVSWQNDSSSVDCLKDAPYLCPPRDLLDQDRGQSFAPEFLVHTQEIDLNHRHTVLVYSYGLRNSRNESYHFTASCGSFDTDGEVPVPGVSRHVEGPTQELGRIVESKHGIAVFYVVIGEQIVHLFADLFVVQIAAAPFKAFRQRVRFISDLAERRIEWSFLQFLSVLIELDDGLVTPELVRFLFRFC